MHQARHADPDAAALDAVLHAALPKADVTPERQDEIVEAFIGHLRASCFPDCAEGAHSAWLGPEGATAATRMRERLEPSPVPRYGGQASERRAQCRCGGRVGGLADWILRAVSGSGGRAAICRSGSGQHRCAN